MTTQRPFPHILAPAGDKDAFLAAMAAGADAIFCGLKLFSARMEADNFGMEELARVTELARSRDVEVHVTFNSLVKQDELEKTARIFRKLASYVDPHALIIQDPGLIPMARQAGLTGKFHLSTLGNASCSIGINHIRQQGFDQVVLPRELSVDEMKIVAEKAPDDLGLEVFIHGALCYAVSGRCYWSSWFGGKSGLRGRCVQPCRRIYRMGKEQDRFFSCMDLGIDVLVKVLKQIPKITTWKIEGRKKSPHYVFYTVKAYKMLRDEGHDPQKRKIALSFLDYAMGRPTTHYHFLPQRQINPLDQNTETGSGMFLGRIKQGQPSAYFITREPLFAGDLLRMGYEDGKGKGHTIKRVTRSIPKKGKYTLPKGTRMPKDAPVFLIDRKEPEIMALIQELDQELAAVDSPPIRPVPSSKPETDSRKKGKTSLPGKRGTSRKTTPKESVMMVYRSLPGRKSIEDKGLWLLPGSIPKLPKKQMASIWWWLPPVVWPDREEELRQAVAAICGKGARRFVLNMVWQIAMLSPKSMECWAGPFCNIANTRTIENLASLGFSGAMASPELGAKDFLALPKASPLPLGVVIKGNWPLSISRIISPQMKTDTLFTSPRKEGAWISQRWDSHWIFPQWELDITDKQQDLQTAGYKKLVILNEPMPPRIDMKQRQGLWNWNSSIL